MAVNPIDKTMVKSIHEVGKVMGIKTIAKFVEDEAIIESCRSFGIDYLQAYGISKPFSLLEI
ncbi:MAG: EAL domain-containing protein (putative c-di-GMP-specific phosphodiesterase class I) [Polaribacter sp.]|jgi:EAL domain-containing protein (putative c-di-GMP-specific phosphodiesterase class I)